MENPSPLDARRHDLDALRAFAMLLGIALHAALSFTGGPWMVQDTRTNAAFHIFVGAVHGFRMPLFFVLSGFFTAMLWRRRGLRALLSHRARRVLLPLLLGAVTSLPLMFTLGGMALKRGSSQAEKAPPTLWRACAAGNVPLVQQFLDEGMGANLPDPALGLTPLTYASLFGHESVARLLLERGADARQANADGGTALHAAAFFGHAEITRALLEAGADPQAKNGRGETALDATLVDWRTTQRLTRLFKVPAREASVRAGRAEVRQLLGAEAAAPEPRPLLGLWLFLRHVPVFAHLWFLWFLCWMVAGFALCAWAAPRLGWQAKKRPWVSSGSRHLWLVPLTCIPAWLMPGSVPNFGPDTSSSLLPPLPLLGYYAVFFSFGALYFESQDASHTLGRRWLLALVTALLFLFPAGLATTHPSSGLRVLALPLEVLYTWLMCAGMIGLFRRFLARERGWVRYLSDASYWMYLAHLPLVVAAQLWLREWPLPALVKFLLICIGTFTLLLLSYEYLVRYTWLGTLLNGRKTRPAG